MSKEKKAYDMILEIRDCSGKVLDKLPVDKKIFGDDVNKFVIQQAVLMYLANRRQGTASTKTRAYTHGGGRKPWRQKGTGQARAGSIRSPLWRGGGKIFGPHPRDYSYQLSPKVKREALRSSLNVKLLEKNVILVDSIKIEEPKTKNVQDILNKLGVKNKAILVVNTIDQKLTRAANNIAALNLKLAAEVTAYDVMSCEKMIVTKDAFEAIGKRLMK